MATDIQNARGRGWLVTVLCASFMSINYADKVIVGLAAVPIMEDLHLQPKEFGLLGSAFFLLYSLSAIGVGFLADRLSTKLIIASLATVWAVTLVPMAVTASFAILILSRVVLARLKVPRSPSPITASSNGFATRSGPFRPRLSASDRRWAC
jgi:MFS transporter, ACS family, D-galactonate transporter